MTAAKPGFSADCAQCSRLACHLAEVRAEFPDYHAKPVAPFGAARPRLLIVGLAPGMHGANRTGRPFTGDYAGDLLYATLLKFGLARGHYGVSADDGLKLVGCRITNAVRCVPPENKPTGVEIATCRHFLEAEIAALKRLKAILALGAIAHASAVAALGLKQSQWRFGHGAVHALPGGLLLADSYHCSRYNTNTGRLTTEMFEAVFRALKPRLGG